MTPYYQDEWVTLYHADCYEIVPTLNKVDLCITDPPYLLSDMGGGGAFGDRPHLVNTKGFTDGGFEANILNHFESWFCFCSRHNMGDLLKYTSERWAILQWCKPNPVPTCNNKYLPDVEYCVHTWAKGRLFGEMKDKSLYFVHPCGNKETSHPNEKPLPLILKLIRLGTLEGEMIIDPFAGSGTTGVAAKLLNRHCILIEQEEKWCEVSARRLSQAVFDFSEKNKLTEKRK